MVDAPALTALSNLVNGPLLPPRVPPPPAAAAPLPWGSAGPADWTQGTVVILGSGPSLAGLDLEDLLDGREIRAVVAVKAAAFAYPRATVCVSADHRWTRRALPWAKLRPPLFLSVDDDWAGPLPPGATLLRRLPPGADPGALSQDPHALAMGSTSGFAALNYALLRGAWRVVLLGYDYRHGPQDQHHADPSMHAWYRSVDRRWWQGWTEPFTAAAPGLHAAGVRVINCTPDSALHAFPEEALDAALPRR